MVHTKSHSNKSSQRAVLPQGAGGVLVDPHVSPERKSIAFEIDTLETVEADNRGFGNGLDDCQVAGIFDVFKIPPGTVLVDA